MGRLLDKQKGKGKSPEGKPAAMRQEPLGEGRADVSVQAAPAITAPAMPQVAEAPASPPPATASPATISSPQAQATHVPASSPAPLTVSQPAPSGAPREMDEGVLRALPEDVFLNFAQSTFASKGLASQQDILLASIDQPDIAAILKVAKDRNVISRLIVRPSATSAPQGPEESGPVSAYGATMASNVGMAAPESVPQAPAPAESAAPPNPGATVAVGPRRQPPPPPPRRSMPPPPATEVTRDLPESEVAKFHRELRDSGDSTKDRLERAEAFFSKVCNAAFAKHGKAALEQALVTAKKKMQSDAGADPKYSELEQFMVDLSELKKFIEWLKSNLQREIGFHERKANGNNGGSEKPAAPSMPPPAPAQASVAAAPAPAQGAPIQQGQQRAEPTPETMRPSTPPSAPQAGKLSRFLSSYTTWSILGIAGFSGALAYTHQFRDLAIGAKNIIQFVSNRQISDIPTAWAVGVYSAVMASVVIFGTLITRAMVRSAANSARARAQRSDADKAKMKYISRKLSEIMLKCVREKEQLSQLRQELRSDETFFAAMYCLRNEAVFAEILEEAGVSGKLRGTIRSTLITQTEQEIMQRKLNRFADIVYSPRERANLFRKMYEDDPVFRLVCDELFLKNLSGDRVNAVRVADVFAFVANSKNENVGEPLLKALSQDYDDIISTRNPGTI